jgi:hypothetical protein
VHHKAVIDQFLFDAAAAIGPGTTFN